MNPFEYWERFRLAEPHWLWFVLVIIALIIVRLRQKQRNSTLKFSSLILLRGAEPRSAWPARLIPPTFRLFALVCLPIALARPQLDESTRTIQESGVDIVLAVDLSASMLALDMSKNPSEPITRLEVVKRVIKDFVSMRKHDRIGLIGFSVNPYLLSPLTLDKEHLHRNLDRMRVGLTLQTGTNIGGALGEGINRVRELEAKSRIVILLTDGKDDPPPRHSPLVFAEGAKEDGIKIYTIAVGQSTRTRTYIYDRRTGDLLRNSSGNPEVTIANYPVDKEVLRKVAETTGAKFFEAGDETALRDIYEEIDQLEKTEVAYEVNALYKELFHWPLAAGIILLLIEIVLSRTVFLRIP